jgi:Rrf2 family protein
VKISTKGRYGLRALVDLASHAQTEAVSLINVAQRQKISLNYLEQVFATLRKAGVVKSQKGAQGGYLLAKRAEDIKVGDVLTALEGSFNIIDEIEDQDDVQAAIQELVWDQINDAVNGYLRSCSLADLVDQYEQSNDSGRWMYYI